MSGLGIFKIPAIHQFWDFGCKFAVAAVNNTGACVVKIGENVGRY